MHCFHSLWPCHSLQPISIEGLTPYQLRCCNASVRNGPHAHEINDSVNTVDAQLDVLRPSTHVLQKGIDIVLDRHISRLLILTDLFDPGTRNNHCRSKIILVEYWQDGSSTGILAMEELLCQAKFL